MLGESVEQRKSYLRRKLSKFELSTPQHLLKFAESVLSTAIRIGDLKFGESVLGAANRVASF